MPTISMFFGLVIRMFYSPKEHNPPHIHVEYQNEEAIIDFNENSVIKGSLSSRHLNLVKAWIEIHREELQANWRLCQNGEQPFKIEPLK